MFHKLWCTSELSRELAKNKGASKQLVEIRSKVAFPEWSPEEPKYDLGKEVSMDK